MCRVPKEAAEVRDSIPAAHPDRDLDLEVRKLTPGVQGGAFAAATVAACPQKQKPQVKFGDICVSILQTAA